MAFEAEETFRRALASLQAGQPADAERSLKRVLRAQPRHAGALNLLAVVMMQFGRFAEAEEFARRAAKESPGSEVTYYNYGLILKSLGRPGEALERFSQALAINAAVPETWNNRGVVFNDLGRFSEAVADFDKALVINANYPEALCNKANALAALKRFDLAIDAYGKALVLDPALAEAWIGRGNVHSQLKESGEALAAYQRAVALKSDRAEAWLGLGNANAGLRQHEEALTAYDRALAIQPDLGEAWVGRGNVYTQINRYDDAFAAYDKALVLNPSLAEAWIGRGNTHYELKRYDEALAAYDKAKNIKGDITDAWLGRGNVYLRLGRYSDALAACDEALALRPGLAEAWVGRGNVCLSLFRFDQAEIAYEKALTLKPNLAEAWVGRGNILVAQQRHDEAVAAYDKALAIDPDLNYVASNRLQERQFLCDWTAYDEEVSQLLGSVRQGRATCAPFVLLSVPSSSADRLRCARLFVDDKYPAMPPLWQGDGCKHDRIRIAYLSADFREHATSVLLSGVLECHDKSRFEIAAISWAPDGNSAMRDRIRKSVDRFVDVAALEHTKIAELLRGMEVDIAVDLMGFTLNSRTDIFAGRPAPVQVNYLGYPGTMGSEYYDYIIADKTVIPDDQRAFYAEQVVWLPDSYQANDRKRHVAEQSFTRIGCGLPENGFVFCSFNNTYKITPDVFDVWMRLLQGVEGSVLWLLDSGATTSKNLRREAEQRGVSAERLIFAPRMRLDDHLARHRLADLFLDTLPCNAHTTASDALWAGLPMVTCLGPTFAGRVAASLLKAVGLDELVTATVADYEALALKLALDSGLLGALKAKLAANCLTAPLFDTPRYTRHLEAAYVTMWERYQRGQAPAHFAVDA